MIVVYFDGGVDYLVIDTGDTDQLGEARVVAVTPGLSNFDEPLPVSSSDFGTLFLESLREELNTGD